MLSRHCGDHFPIHTNVRPLCCTPGTNEWFCVNYTATKIIVKIQLENKTFKKEKKPYTLKELRGHQERVHDGTQA